MRIYSKLFTLMFILLSSSLGCTQSHQEIYGLYKAATPNNDRVYYAQVTAIQGDVFWLSYGGKLSAVKAIPKKGYLELSPLNQKENASFIIKNNLLSISQNGSSYSLKKIELPLALRPIFASNQDTKLYEIDESDGKASFKENFIVLNKTFQLVDHRTKRDGEKGCSVYFLMLDLSEPVSIRKNDKITQVGFRSFIDDEAEFNHCNSLGTNKQYQIRNREMEGFLYFNPQGDLIGILQAGYMSASLHINQRYPAQQTFDLITRFAEQHSGENR